MLSRLPKASPGLVTNSLNIFHKYLLLLVICHFLYTVMRIGSLDVKTNLFPQFSLPEAALHSQSAILLLLAN